MSGKPLMHFHRHYRLLILMLSGFCVPGLMGKPMVLVSIPPQKAFVEAVAGNEVEVMVLIKPGQNPTNFSVTPHALAKMSRAHIYFTVGVPMEAALLPRLQSKYPDIQIIDTASGIRKRSLEDHFHHLDTNEESHDHLEDPHIWMSPGLVKIQMRHYLRALQNLKPKMSQKFDQAATAFLQEVADLDDQLKESLQHLKGATVFVYHPAFGYFLERYGLRQETVEVQGKQPTPQQLRFLIYLAREHKSRVIFVQPQFDRHSAQALAKAIGGKVESMDPLAENYLDNLRRMGETIADSYQ